MDRDQNLCFRVDTEPQHPNQQLPFRYPHEIPPTDSQTAQSTDLDPRAQQPNAWSGVLPFAYRQQSSHGGQVEAQFYPHNGYQVENPGDPRGYSGRSHNDIARENANRAPAGATYRIPIDPAQLTPEIAARKATAESVPLPTIHCDADRHAITEMHEQLVNMRYAGLQLRDRINADHAAHQAQIVHLNQANAHQIEAQHAQQSNAVENLRFHTVVQEARIKELVAERLTWEQKRAQLNTDIEGFKELVKEKDNKIWKYTQQLGDKAADLDMVRGDRDANRDMVKELKTKVIALEHEKETAGRK